MLAITPASRGFGFIVTTNTGSPLAWGVKEIRRHKNARCIYEVNRLIDAYQPSVLAIEDRSAPEGRRRPRVRHLLTALEELAKDRDVKLAAFGLARVRAVVGVPPRASKDDIAAAVALALPALAAQLPKKRNVWETERYAMPIFIAAALALCCLRAAQRRTG